MRVARLLGRSAMAEEAPRKASPKGSRRYGTLGLGMGIPRCSSRSPPPSLIFFYLPLKLTDSITGRARPRGRSPSISIDGGIRLVFFLIYISGHRPLGRDAARLPVSRRRAQDDLQFSNPALTLDRRECRGAFTTAFIRAAERASSSSWCIVQHPRVRLPRQARDHRATRLHAGWRSSPVIAGHLLRVHHASGTGLQR